MIKLVKHPNPILDKQMPAFDFENPLVSPSALEALLVLTMYEENGRGIAAPQVGIATRVFAMKPEKTPGLYEPFAAFNPRVLDASTDTEEAFEGCLSFPDMFLDVRRPKTIVAEFVDRDNVSRIIELTGIDARCFLHELDHLDGICFINRVSKLKLNIAKRKMTKHGRTK